MDSVVDEVKNENSKDKNLKITDRKKLPRIYVYILYFLLFSFIGWIIETCFSFYALGHFTKRGFLYGPLCPIYGWGALILILEWKLYFHQNGGIIQMNT